MYVLGLFFNCNLALIRLNFHVYSYFTTNQNKENIKLKIFSGKQ